MHIMPLWKKLKAATLRRYRQLTGKPAAPPCQEITREREPPKPATPLDFPACTPRGQPRNRPNEHQNLVKAFNNIPRTGPTKQHLDALNISVVADTPVDQLCPTDYLPPLSWSKEPTSTEGKQRLAHTSNSSPKLSNGAPMPARKEFYDVVRELTYDNEDAFRALRRQGPLQGHPPARIVQFRKFWDGLMTMADFWDTSADHYYYDTPANPTDDTGGDDRAAMDVVDLRSDAQEADRDIGTANEGNSNNNNTGGDNESAMNIDDMPSDAHDADEDTSTANEENDNSQGKRRYTGHRISTGSEMSGRFRDDTVVAFVQTIALAFRCRLDFPQLQQQKLNMQGMVFPLPVAGSVYRVPKDRNEAKKGVREGPLLGVWPRDQLCFRRPGDTIGEGKLEALDLLKEVGLGMMLAQKRAREGKVEDIPGTEKWWAHAPRWGGGRGGRMSMPEEEMVELPASHVSQQLEGIPDAETVQARVYRGSQQPSKTPERETVEEPVSDRSQPRKNVRKTGSWPDIQPPGRTWEKNVKYQQVGRHWESDYDHIYLISSINHHISIVHLRVPLKYIKHFEQASDRNKATDPKFREWYSLELHRSKWFDLFNAEDRMQAMRAVWAIMGYLMRDA